MAECSSMISRWFNFKRHKAESVKLKAIFIAAAGGDAMMSVNDVKAVAHRGLHGDRYCDDKGHWKSIDGCQVTLITEHDLEQVKKIEIEFKDGLDHGSHRRNLVIDGLKTKHLEGKDFRIGGAVFRYDKARPPCAYLDKISGKGMCRAMSHHSGVCIRVITGGRLAVGDTVEIIETN